MRSIIQSITIPSAATTGLLSPPGPVSGKKLGSLTPRHLFLDAPVPYLTVPASYSKRNDTQFLHPGLVELLKSWLAKRNPRPEEILFPISKEISGVDRNTAEMIAYDLAAARRFWISESETSEEKEKREQSDFLKYKDSQDKFADFHGLRHTFITNLSLNGVDPKTAQTLARHFSAAEPFDIRIVRLLHKMCGLDNLILS